MPTNNNALFGTLCSLFEPQMDEIAAKCWYI